MPFDNLSKPSDGYLVDGLVEDITLALSRVPDFCVIARHSAFAFKGRASLSMPAKSDGSWAPATSLKAPFSATAITFAYPSGWSMPRRQSSCGRSATPASSPTYSSFKTTSPRKSQAPFSQRFASGTGPRQTQASNLAAYDCVLRGISIQNHGHATTEEAKEAVAWFDRALELDPNYARALAWRACAAAGLWPLQPTQEHLDRNMDLVSRALSIDPTDSEAHRIKGALHTLQRQFDLAAYHLERARDLNPNDAHILVKGGLYSELPWRAREGAE